MFIIVLFNIDGSKSRRLCYFFNFLPVSFSLVFSNIYSWWIILTRFQATYQYNSPHLPHPQTTPSYMLLCTLLPCLFWSAVFQTVLLMIIWWALSPCSLWLSNELSSHARQFFTLLLHQIEHLVTRHIPDRGQSWIT